MARFENNTLFINGTKRLFKFGGISNETARTYRETANGVYSINLIGTTAESLAMAGRGFSLEACEIMVGKYIFMRTFTEEVWGERVTRAVPIAEQFTDEEASIIFSTPDASFKYRALTSRYVVSGVNSFFNPIYNTYKYRCVYCGKMLTTLDHGCDDITCYHCGAVLRGDALINYKNTGVALCESCARDEASTLHDYHGRRFRSHPLFEKPAEREKHLHIGAEIEIDGDDEEKFIRDDVCFEFNTILNYKNYFKPFAEFERDGSLNSGVEVITAPTTFKGFKARYSDIRAFYDTAREQGGIFKKANGLHFHIDRTFFGDNTEDVAKGAILIEMMVYKYFDFFATICRRPANAFGYAHKKNNVNGVVTACLHSHQQEHSMAVNGSGSNTVELRIFGGQIDNADDFFACLDITHALAKWAKKASLLSAEKATPCNIISYLADPSNVLAFVTHLNRYAPHTEQGNKWLAEFKTALNVAIDKRMSREGK